MTSVFQYIFTVEFAYSVLRVTTPILFAALASIIAERSGASNIALEGIMLFAALAGAAGSGLTGGSLFCGFLFAILGGLVIAVLLAYFGLYLKTDIILAGIALNTLAAGGTVFLMFALTGDKGSTSSLKPAVFPKIELPFIENIPVFGKIFSGQNTLTYIAFFMVFAVWALLFKTKLGLRLRAVGENAEAAASVGIHVKKIQFTALLISGFLASLGGAFLSMGYMNGFTRGMVSGRGFIALAAAAMGQLSPLPTMLASLVFGFFDALSNILAAMRIPDEFVKIVPYMATVLGLIIFSAMRTLRLKKSKKLALNGELNK
ncbi:MAG: ABC transporter permease [Spirochaetaceae bacterium]|jgi:simple sugar transport system permease protein|nr:ABC transporter permease [Spirochaetaceae bacterium]GMO23602.1 MAG: ABC transporter permease [Termitinemataceae bacterium]